MPKIRLHFTGETKEVSPQEATDLLRQGVASAVKPTRKKKKTTKSTSKKENAGSSSSSKDSDDNSTKEEE